MRTAFALLAALCLPAGIAAQTYSGRYTMPNQQGGIITLALDQDAQGKIAGTLSGNGVTFQVAGSLENGSAVGTITNDQGGMYFHATIKGGQLTFTIIGVGANNEPDYSQTEEWSFTRQGAAATQPTPAPSQPSRPATGMGGMASSGGADAAVGTFSNGTLTVQLSGGKGRYTGVASLQEQQYPMQAQGSGAELSGTYTADGASYPWTARVQGDVMVISVDGQTLQLQRQGSGAVAMAPQPSRGAAGAGASQGVRPEPQYSDLSAQGQEWDQWLRGKRLTQMDSYSSSGGGDYGGYSSRKTLDLCRDGRFFYNGSSSVSVDVGGGAVSGYNGGQDGGAGQWRIIEQGQVVGVELRWADGSVTQHRLEYQDQATYVDGTRTYVTQDNSSC